MVLSYSYYEKQNGELRISREDSNVLVQFMEKYEEEIGGTDLGWQSILAFSDYLIFFKDNEDYVCLISASKSLLVEEKSMVFNSIYLTTGARKKPKIKISMLNSFIDIIKENNIDYFVFLPEFGNSMLTQNGLEFAKGAFNYYQKRKKELLEPINYNIGFNPHKKNAYIVNNNPQKIEKKKPKKWYQKLFSKN